MKNFSLESQEAQIESFDLSDNCFNEENYRLTHKMHLLINGHRCWERITGTSGSVYIFELNFDVFDLNSLNAKIKTIKVIFADKLYTTSAPFNKLKSFSMFDFIMNYNPVYEDAIEDEEDKKFNLVEEMNHVGAEEDWKEVEDMFIRENESK